jgi:DNA-binding response OmpR family regulator
MPRILVIDDQPHVRASIKIALEAKKFDVVLVESGREGLREFDASSFDLAIVDIYLPDMDGVNIIKAFRKRKPNFPIVAISGIPVSESGRTMLEFLPMVPNLATVVCLQKPFRLNQLLDAIQNAIGIAA